jgi:Zn-dependent protease
MDRQGILMDQFQNEQPIHPQGTLRRSLERAGGLAVLIGGTALKFGFIFVKFLGHVAEARHQGLKVSWPTFIPFFGAFVTIERAGLTPWKNALISLAGPFTGGAASAIVWVIGSARGSTQLEVLANIAFLLNAFNMLPIGFLDGGQTIHAAREEWRMPRIQFEAGVPVAAFAPDRTRALVIVGLYVGLAALLVIGMLATRPTGGGL